jgi:hypothetical protein
MLLAEPNSQTSDDQLYIAVSLKWKRIEPFYEVLKNGAERFGFRVMGHQK